MFNTHPNTVNVQRHRPNTIQYPPKTFPRHYLCTNLSQQKQAAPTDTPWHPQTLPGVVWGWLKPESVCWRQLVSVGMCWLLLLSGYVLSCRRWGWGMGEVGVMAVYEWCLWVSEVFAGVWRVISVLIPWMVENSYCFGIVLKSQIVFTRSNWEIKMSTYILNKNGWVCHFLVL